MDSPITKPGTACAGPGLEAATPVAVYWGGSDAVPASAKHSQTMSKDWYAETCIPYGLHATGRQCQSRRVAASIRPPRLLVEDNGASHPLRESGGGLGMVFSLSKH